MRLKRGWLFKCLCGVVAGFFALSVAAEARVIIAERTGNITITLPDGSSRLYRKTDPLPANLEGATIVVHTGVIDVSVAGGGGVKVISRGFESALKQGDSAILGVGQNNQAVVSVKTGEVTVKSGDMAAKVKPNQSVELARNAKTNDISVTSTAGNIEVSFAGVNAIVNTNSAATLTTTGGIIADKGTVTVVDSSNQRQELTKGQSYIDGQITKTQPETKDTSSKGEMPQIETKIEEPNEPASVNDYNKDQEASQFSPRGRR